MVPHSPSPPLLSRLLFPAVAANGAFAAVLPCPGLLVRGGAGGKAYDYPPSMSARTPLRSEDGDHPPVEVVVGAGVAGALAGHVVFKSLLVSVGLGVGTMSIAASSEGNAGEIARSSGRMVQAAFERTREVNERYQLTGRVAEGIQSAAKCLQDFDREHAIVHKATEATKRTWRNARKLDDDHKLTERAGQAMRRGFDKLAQVLEAPQPKLSSPSHGGRPHDSSSGSGSSSSGGVHGGVYRTNGGGRSSRPSGHNQGAATRGGGAEENHDGSWYRYDGKSWQQEGGQQRGTRQEDVSRSSSPPWRGDGDGSAEDWWGESGNADGE